jgi:hypothetical protein
MPTLITFGAMAARAFGATSALREAYWGLKVGTTGESWYGQDCAIDGSGNYIVTGYSLISGQYRNYIAKYSSAGVVTWASYFGAAAATSRTGFVSVDLSNNIYAYFNVAPDAYIVKYNSSGTVQWQRKLTNVYPGKFGLDSSANIYLAAVPGSLTSTTTIVKYDTAGTILASASSTTAQGATQRYAMRSVAVDSSGNCYLFYSSFTDLLCCGFFAYAAITKLNSSLAWQWSRYTSDALGLAGYLFINSSGAPYALSEPGSAGRLTAFDTSGTVTASASFPELYSAYGADASGNVYVVSPNASGTNTFIKLNSSLTVQWQRAFSATGQTVQSTTSVIGSTTVLVSSGVSTATNVYAQAYRLPTSAPTTGTFSPYTIAAGAVTVGTTARTWASRTDTWSSAGVTDSAGAITSTSFTPTTTLVNFT